MLWMSSGGTTSVIHSHADHNIHCLLDGRKDFILIDPRYKDMLDYVQVGMYCVNVRGRGHLFRQ